MTRLGKLQTATRLADVAKLLGYETKALSYILYVLPPDAKYTEFAIPKRDGGRRRILAPTPMLKRAQQCLAELLYDALREIGKNKPPGIKVVSHGFTKDHSIITNAEIHNSRRYVLNLDLKDFFPSINFGRVRGVLIKDKRFRLHPNVATVIAQIACHENALPQGSPCSPVISNIIGNLLDMRLVCLAKEYKCTYSRYADDITFSTNNKYFPAVIAAPSSGSNGDWVIGPTLSREITRAGFVVNPKKTRMQLRGSRQMTTGLLVNVKPNTRPEYYREARAMCQSLFNTGTYYRIVPATLAGGKPGDSDVRREFSELDVLQGILAHIYQVKSAVDDRRNREKNKSKKLSKSKKSDAEKREERERADVGKRRLYREFLFYKHFVTPAMPLLVTEGKTDPVYVRAAIEMLPEYHPRLGKVEMGRFTSELRFLKLSSTAEDLIGLGYGGNRGDGVLAKFVGDYSNNLRPYRHRPMQHPIIVLVDNDTGGDNVINAARKRNSKSMSCVSGDHSFRVTDNLYIIKTPEVLTADGRGCIEYLFDEELRNREVGGKVFELRNDVGKRETYSKKDFAERIVRADKATINFANFAELLKRMVVVLDHYAQVGPMIDTNQC